MTYRPDRCLGCRYCMVSCPFGVPRFEWEDGLTPEIRKCMFCIERQQRGPAAGLRGELPVGRVEVRQARRSAEGSPRPHRRQPELLREPRLRRGRGRRHGDGSTSRTCRSSMLGFRTDVTTRPIPAYTWDIMSKLPLVVGGLAVVLTGASVVTRRGNSHHDDTPPWNERVEGPKLKVRRRIPQ